MRRSSGSGAPFLAGIATPVQILTPHQNVRGSAAATASAARAGAGAARAPGAAVAATARSPLPADTAIFEPVPRVAEFGCGLRALRVGLDVVHVGGTVVLPPAAVVVFFVLLGRHLDGESVGAADAQDAFAAWSVVFAPLLIAAGCCACAFAAALGTHVLQAEPPATLVSVFEDVDPKTIVPFGAEEAAMAFQLTDRFAPDPSPALGMAREQFARMFGRRSVTREDLLPAPHPRRRGRCGTRASSLRWLADGDRPTPCGCVVQDCVFEDARGSPRWVHSALVVAVVLLLLLQPWLAWLRASGTLSTSWGGIFTPLWIALALLAIVGLPLLVRRFEWSRVRLVVGVVGCLVLAPFLLVLPMLVSRIDAADVHFGGALVPFFLVELLCCLPVGAFAAFLFLRAPPTAAPHDPAIVLPAYNPRLREQWRQQQTYEQQQQQQQEQQRSRSERPHPADADAEAALDALEAERQRARGAAPTEPRHPPPSSSPSSSSSSSSSSATTDHGRSRVPVAAISTPAGSSSDADPAREPHHAGVPAARGETPPTSPLVLGIGRRASTARLAPHSAAAVPVHHLPAPPATHSHHVLPPRAPSPAPSLSSPAPLLVSRTSSIAVTLPPLSMPVSATVSTTTSPYAALGPAPTLAPTGSSVGRLGPWYNDRFVGGLHWGAWASLACVVVPLLLFVWGVVASVAIERPDLVSATGGVLPGVLLFALMSIAACFVAATLLRMREALGGAWSGLYGGPSRAVVMNNSNSLD